MAGASNHRGLFTALLGGAVGIGIGVATGVWWGRRVPGHIYRDGDDWYADGPVLRELQRRMHGSGGTQWQGGYYFSLLGHGVSGRVVLVISSRGRRGVQLLGREVQRASTAPSRFLGQPEGVGSQVRLVMMAMISLNLPFGQRVRAPARSRALFPFSCDETAMMSTGAPTSIA